ncbi:MAG: sigma-70 family RNA polymerase sigma factor [Capsulimonadales bacterium]|nr:sigma-70 family RNA polymerase sigma factor [Capsulimonadales bacterium]
MGPVFRKWCVPLPGMDTERRLLKAARENDRAAFDRLIQAHQERLRAFLMRRVGPDAAEDVLQETLLAAWQAIPRLDLRVRFKTWLFSIAVRKVADHHRVQGRLQRQEVAFDTARLPSPIDALDAAERRVMVRRLLDGLNDDQRQILEMYYFAELTLPEIATILGRNLNTLKYQFYRIHAVTAETFAEPQEGVVVGGEEPSAGRRETGAKRLAGRKGLSAVR